MKETTNKTSATVNPAQAKGEKTMKETRKETVKKPATGKKEVVKATISEDASHFELIVPTIQKGEKVGEWSITTTTKKPLAIPTKCENKEVMLVDVQRALLDTMKENATSKKAKLDKAKKEKPEEWTDNKQLELDQQTSLIKTLDIQRKKYVSTKYNPLATMCAGIMTNTALSIEVKPLVSNIRSAWNDLLEVMENLYAGKDVKLTTDQQAQITDIKKTIIAIATPYCAEIKNGDKVISKAFPLSLGNKDIFKLLIALYSFYRKDGKGNMIDGLKLDGKEERQLKLLVVNLVFAKMTGAK